MSTKSPSPATTPEPASTLRAENASTHETTDDNFVAPGVTNRMVTEDAADQIEALTQFLDNNFPGEMQRTNTQVPETPVETAMRLLLGLSSRASAGVTRCTDAYCNKMMNHKDAHGWVHVG